MRYAKRTDDNHRDVVDEFKTALPDASVLDLSGTGRGCPDIMVGWQHRNFLFEIKDPSKPPSKRKLTRAQSELHPSWQGQISVVHSAAEMCAEIARSLIKTGNADCPVSGEAD